MVVMIEDRPGFVPVSTHPIFRLDQPEFSMFYAPGCLCVTERAEADQFEKHIGPPASPETTGWHHQLWLAADRALRDFDRIASETFAPECLTLYLNNECNLNCVYCYADPLHRASARLEIDAVAAAAEVVAANCKIKGLPFAAVFHGGGEPTLHLDHAAEILTTLEQVAQAHDVRLFRYLATNGVLSRERAVWVAEHFDLMGLSCDGPPDIQDRQRPRFGGGGTSEAVLRTVDILHKQGCAFQVRVTITAATLARQSEIAAYICQHIEPQAIHFEPVYLSEKDADVTRLETDSARTFVQHFLAAQDVAHASGIPLSCSGTRIGTIHGPYCQVFRQVINLIPPGVATACFKVTRAEDAYTGHLQIGALDARTRNFQLDHDHIQHLRDRLSVIPTACADCFNRFHCVRQCPDACPLDEQAAARVESFRCRVQKTLALHVLQAAARDLWAEYPLHTQDAGESIRAHGTTTL